MTQKDAEKWDRKYRDQEQTCSQAAKVLFENQYLLPTKGCALDVACGLGANSLILAEHGLETHAWDISKQALGQLENNAANLNINLTVEQRDIVTKPPGPESFDIIVVCRFLDRSLIPQLIKAIRQDGLIFYQTFIKDKRDKFGPSKPEYRLDANELLSLFKSMQIVFYREDARIGALEKGFRNEAMLIAQK